LIAPFEPSVSTVGSMPREARNSSTSVRVPEPGSRSSHGRMPSSSMSTHRRRASGSSALVTSTKSLSAKSTPTRRSSSGIRPVTATSTLWSSTRWNTTWRFPTSSEISTSGRRSRNAWIS
jgi:hypothetical protein